MTVHDEIERLWAQFAEIATRAQAEEKRSGAPSAESSLALDSISATLDKLEAQLARQTAPGSLHPAGEPGRLVLNGKAYEYDTGTAEHATFVRALREGVRGTLVGRVKLADLSEQQKAMSLGDDTTGGYLASPEFASDLLRLSVDYSPVRQVARVVPLGGVALYQPVRGAPAAAKRISETASRVGTLTDLAFRLESVPAHESYTTTVMSRHMLADSHYPLADELAESASRATALMEGVEFIKGTGVGEMVGLNATSLPTAQVITAADSTGHTIAPDDITKLVFEALKPAYLPGARVLLNSKTLSKLRQLRATTGNTYLFPPDLGAFSILGLPYTIANDLDEQGVAGKTVMYVGDFRQAYTVVVRMDITVLRLVEIKAEVGQVEFVIFQRSGGQVVNADGLARLITG